MTNDPLLKKLNALLDEKESDALNQELDEEDYFDQEDIADTAGVVSEDISRSYQQNRFQEDFDDQLSDKTDHSREGFLAPLDQPVESIASSDDDFRKEKASSRGLISYFFVGVISFLLGGILFQILLSKNLLDMAGVTLPGSFSVSNSDEFLARVESIENLIKETDSELRALKHSSLELSNALADINDLNSNESFLGLKNRIENLEKTNFDEKSRAINLSVGSYETLDGINSWFVNFGTYDNLQLAKIWADRIENEDFSVAIETKRDSNPEKYRVRIINLNSLEEARLVASRLASRYKLSPLWIDKYQ